ncbi:XRE family transcriptional regulator [Streptomyces sp. NPDC004539]|uniref:nSTAND1 domain-containing NTPase n=1 Tax=Streptomyces sp. NPDC004539 TaxID=3154280 RepID=UPI0033A04AEE
MPRRETPLGTGDSPLLEFAASLRTLRRTAGSPPYRELAERAHYSISTLSSAASGLRLPTLAVTLAYVRACEGDVPEWEDRWRRTAVLIDGRERGTGPEEHDGCGQPVPYAGLRPFREEDAEWFFGRERLVTDLADRLDAHRFVVLLGASGSGKSSLLRAGLAPRLRPTATPLVLTPGPHPLEECAIHLAARTALTPGALYDDLRADPANLGRALRQTAVRDGTPVVLIVDQFEEVFTLCRDAPERASFIGALTAAADGGCRVVLGVRADFYAHCTRDPALVTAMRDTQVPLGPMSPDELRRAVVEPARRAGLTVEGALLATLTAQAHGRPGTLPLLSHALRETWHRRRGTLLTLAALESVGGIEGALVRSAEEFYTGLDDAERTAARHLLLRLTAPGEGTEDTGRRITRGELGSAPDADDVTAAVLEQAAAARLISLDGDRVEITHEALIGGWPRLRAWLAADRDRRRAHRALTVAAEAWETAGRDPGALYRGARLESARRLADPDDAGLSGRERAFLRASLAAEAAEIRTAARSTRRLRALAALLCLMTVLACVATVLSVRAGAEVARQRDDAVALNAAAAATRTYPSDPSLAVQLALVAHRLRPARVTRDALLSSLMTTWTAHRAETYALDVSPDSTLLALAGRDRTVGLWSLRDPRRPARTATLRGHTDAVHAVAFHPRRPLLATAGADRTIRLWDSGTGKGGSVNGGVAYGGSVNGGSVSGGPGNGRAPLAVLTGAHRPLRSLAFSRDGRLLADGCEDGTVRVRSLDDLRHPVLLRAHADSVRALGFSADGRLLATAGQDGTVRLWDLADPGRPVARASWRAHELGVFWLEFHPREPVLATGGGGRESARLWDVTDAARPRRTAGLVGHDDVVGHLAFSPDGRGIATASDDRSVRIWDLTGRVPRETATLTAYPTAVMGVRYTPDGRTLVTTAFDGTARVLATDFGGVMGRACEAVRTPVGRGVWGRYLGGLPFRPPCGGS